MSHLDFKFYLSSELTIIPYININSKFYLPSKLNTVSYIITTNLSEYNFNIFPLK